jgi:hypothetical protein
VTIGPAPRKLALAAHVSSSVGWLGAVASSLALAIAGLVSQDPQTVRGAYRNLELVGWYVLVPLSLGSLVTGLVSSLSTQWGLLRHYWVLAKLLINILSAVVLLMYMQTLGLLASLAAETPGSGDVGALQSSSPVLHAGAALVLLAIATVLGVYKPRGVTRYGWRKEQERPGGFGRRTLIRSA